jgi:predicted dehydrogenase
MDKQVNVAVIGAGYWGEKLIGEYYQLMQRYPNVKLSAIVDNNKERLAHVKKRFNLPDKIFYDGFEEFLRNNELIDAVHIATPNETHFEIALKMIEKGKNILIEKPMTTSSRSAFKLAREAEKKGVVLLVGHIFRFNNAVNKAKQLVEEGALGQIYYLSLKWTTNMQNLPERDIVFDLAPHPIDIINHVLEEWPHSVYARAQSFRRKVKGREEVAFVLLELPGDVLGEIMLSWLQPGIKTRIVEIVGENGALYIDALNQKMQLCRNNEVCSDIFVEANNTIEAMITHFVECILKGSAPLNSPLIGAMTVHVLEKIRESLDKGASVSVMLP